MSAAAVATSSVVTASAATRWTVAWMSRRPSPYPWRSSRTAMFLISACRGSPVLVSCTWPMTSGPDMATRTRPASM